MTEKRINLDPNEAQGFFREITQHVVDRGGVVELRFDPMDKQLKASLFMQKNQGTLEVLCGLVLRAAHEVLSKNCGEAITFAKTAQIVDQIRIKPDVGSFVQFDGDYTGLMIINFSGLAAMNLYRTSMINMGMPEEELAQTFTSDEVVDALGEMINQIIGRFRTLVEQEFGLISRNTQPKAIALNDAITLAISPEFNKNQHRRMSLHFQGAPFHIELALEETQFQRLEGLLDLG